WPPIAVREILHQPLYRGEVIWNRIKKRDQWGAERWLDRPESEWIRLEAPELRIVSEDLWRAAHVRLERVRAAYVTGRPPLDRPHEKYLLSGIAKCGACGGSLMAFADKRSQRRFYGCAWHNKRGAKVCRNPLKIRQDRLDQVVLEAIAEALDERLLERAVDKAIARLTRRRGHAPERRAQLEREL